MKGVTVAVCVYNGEATIEACLSSLLALDYPPELLDILVIDNASTDKTPDIVRRFPVRLLNEPIKGRGSARNRAQIEAIHPVIAFTDADCIVDPSWLFHLMRAFDDEQVGVAGGRIEWEGTDDLTRFQSIRRTLSNEEFSGDYPFSPPFVATANAAFRTEAIRSVGGFRSQYDIEEDAAICWMIQRQGFRLEYVPDALVHHCHRHTIRSFFNHQIFYGIGGVHLFHDFFPEHRVWIWWGLYARFVSDLIRIPFALFVRDSFARKLPLYDALRDAGLIIGRLKGALRYRVLAI